MWDGTGEWGGGVDASVQREGGPGSGCAIRSLWALGTQAPACQRAALLSLRQLHTVYGPLSGAVKPCRENAFFLLLLSVCGAGTWERLSLLLYEHFQLGGFCFHTAASFLKCIREKYLPLQSYSPKPSFHQIQCTISLQRLHDLLEKSSRHLIRCFIELVSLLYKTLHISKNEIPPNLLHTKCFMIFLCDTFSSSLRHLLND